MKNVEQDTQSRYSCVHIGSVSADKIRCFRVGREEGHGLERYIRADALYDEAMSTARTYLVMDNITDEVVAYFSLKAGYDR